MDDRQRARSVSPPSSTERHLLADARNPSGFQKETTQVQKPVQTRKPNLVDRLFRNSWVWEFLSAWFSLVCLIIIVVVLRYEDSKQLDQWNLIIGPNAVVSFIGALAKSAFMVAIPEIISQLKWLHYHKLSDKLADIDTFDESSRGPWGATKLIVGQNRKTLLASWASIITIAALLIDPFLQLVFSFPSRLTMDPSLTPGIQMSHVYDPGNHLYETDVGSYSDASSVNAAMQSDLLSAAFGNTISHPVNCQGTHCSWTNVTSLGVCSSCEDMTTRVEKRCYLHHGNSTCNYTFNSGIMLQALWWSDDERGTQSTLFNISGESTATDDAFAFAIGFKTEPEQATMANFASVKLVNLTNDAYSPAPWNVTPVEAYTCEFHLCSKTYDEINFLNGSVTMSQPHETPLWLYPNLDTSDSGPLSVGWLVPLGPPGNVSDRTAEQSFEINMHDYYGLGGYLEEIFTISLDSTRSQQRSPNGSGEGNAATPEIGISLFESLDLPRVAQAVAEGMSEAMRTCANSTTIYGTGENYKTFISVDFRWLALPAILIVMTLILLVITVIVSSRSNLPVWKSSGLAPFFHRLEGWGLEDMQVADADQLHERARNMRATLSDDGGGVVFLKRD